MHNFKVTIITKEKLKLETEVYMALLPLYNGEVGIMAGHVNFGSLIVPGLLKLLNQDEKVIFTMFISGGVVEVLEGKLTILADNIINIKDISQEEAYKRINELEESLQNKNTKITEIEVLIKELDSYNKILTLIN